jgi:integrase
MAKVELGYGDGKLRERADGRWEFRKVIDGKRRSFYGASRSEALAGPTRASETARRDAETAADVTVADYAARWTANRRSAVRASTIRHNASALSKWVLPAIGGRKLRTVTVDDVHGVQAAAVAKGRQPGTVRTLNLVMRALFRDAVEDGLIPSNPAAIRAPRVTPRDLSTPPLSVDEVKRLREAARGDRFEALLCLVLTVGMRPGELLALHARDVDTERRTVIVRGTITDAPDGGLTIGETKSRAGMRVVPMTSACAAAFERQLAGLKPDALIFPADNGGLLSPTNFLYRYFYPLLVRAGLPRVTMRDLRHTALTYMVADKVDPVTVAKIAGHSNPSMTLNVYSHATPQGSQHALDSMERRFS